MNKSVFTILTLLAAVFAFAVSAENHKINEYVTDVGQFTTLKVQDNVNVVYSCVPDSTAKVAYHGAPEFANAFIITNSGNTLKIQVNTEDVGNPELPTIYIYSDFIKKVENYSDFNITVNNPAPCPDFTAALIGNGSITVNNLKATKVAARITAGNGRITLIGSCDEADFRMAGTGVIQADELRAKSVICKIVGGGTIGCDPAEFLKVGGLGSTRIYYRGNPKIKHTLGGKLIKID